MDNTCLFIGQVRKNLSSFILSQKRKKIIIKPYKRKRISNSSYTKIPRVLHVASLLGENGQYAMQLIFPCWMLQLHYLK